MRFKVIAIIAAASLVAFAGVALGALTPGQKMGAEALIKQLSSEEFKVREAAVEKLVALGPDVLELINPLLKSTDEELKMRGEMIVKRVQEAHPEGVAATRFDRTKGSLVTLKMTGASLKAVLERIAKQTGNRAPALPENWAGEKPVTVDLDKTPYWEAMDKVLEPQGLMYVSQLNNQGLRLISANMPKALATSYAGPMVFKVISMGRTRTYYGPQGADMAQCQVVALWEEQLKPAWGEQPALEKTTDEKGTELKGQTFNMQSRGVFGRHQESGQRGQPLMTTFYVTIQNVPAEMNKLGELSGKLTAGFGEGTLEMTIADPFGPGQKNGKAGGYELKVNEAKQVGNMGALTAVITKDGKPVERYYFGGDERYGIWLEGQDGKKSPGEIMPEGQSWQWAGSPKAPATTAAPAPKAAPAGLHQIMFHGMPPEGEDVKLRWVLPTEFKTQDYTFKFKDLSAQ